MNLSKKDFKNCLGCKVSFAQIEYCGKGKCRNCYNKEYFKKSEKKYPQKSAFYYEHLAKEHLRRANMNKLHNFIDYVNKNKETINTVDAFILADLFDLFYPKSMKRLDYLPVKNQLVFMWDYIKTLK
jgi:hypothetical protein